MRKGYVFSLDAVIAVIILVIGILLISAIYVYTPDKERTDMLNTDITGMLANVKVGELCADLSTCSCSYPSIAELCANGRIWNSETTLLELFGQLYHENDRVMIERTINETLIDNGIIPGNFGLQILLMDPARSEPQQIYPLVSP
jgi:hypothetical protein